MGRRGADMQAMGTLFGSGPGPGPSPQPVSTRSAVVGKPLSGWNILVVEDDFCVAWESLEILEEAGGKVEGPTSSAEGAVHLLRHRRPDAALIDINLGNGLNFDLADLLQSEGIPFAFATGYSAKSIPERFAGVPLIEKPFEPGAVLAALVGLKYPA